jgi:hypothetical protein
MTNLVRTVLRGRAACAGLFAFLLMSTGAVRAQVAVTTYHNDVARTGQNIQETVLAPANVNSSYFGKLYTTPVDGYVFAQPLYLANVSIAGGTHNVLYVATGHDSVYAIDADTGTVYARVNLIPAGGRTMNTAVDIDSGCTDQVPEVGITGTPVIDPSTGTLYLVTTAMIGTHAYQFLHALDTATLADKFGGPVSITGSVPGTGENSSNGRVAFNPLLEVQRAALLLESGHVIITIGSHCDVDPWHGWVMSYAAGTLQQEAIFNVSPNGSEGGIWMSGGGPAADASGNIYVSTGNGTWDGVTSYGDSVLKLAPPAGGSFAVLDYFTPYDQLALSQGDEDVSAGAPVLLPTLPSGQQLLGLVGKTGTLFELDRNNLGKYCPNLTPACTNSDPQIVAEIPGATSGTWGAPAYWNGNLYWGGSNSTLRAFAFNTTTGSISTAPTSSSFKVFGYPSPTPSVSANGTANGIVWVLDDSEYNSTACSGASTCQALYAFNANNLGEMLYHSNQAPNARDVPGAAVKFAVPTIVNGKVYVGSQYAVSAYGPIAAPPPPGNAVSLSGVANREGLAARGTAITGGGLDGHNQAFAGNLIGAQLTFAGSTFTLGAIGVADAVVNATIALPAGSYSTLNLLATAVNASQPNQTFVVTYTDGSTTNFVQSVSDWSTPQNYAGESIVTTTGYRINASGGTQSGSYSLYGYSFALNAAKSVATLTLPKNNSVAVLALDLTPSGQTVTPPAASPTLAPAPGTYSSATSVSLADATPGAKIYYTTNGTAPTTAATLYSGPIAVNATTTISAIAVASGYTASPVATGTYTIVAPTAATPSFSPAAGLYANAQTVSLSDATAGAVIHYTTDGSTPTANSAQYVSPLTVNATTTIKAIAVASGYATSAVASALYTISTQPVSVSLGSAATLYGLADPGATVTGGGVDGHGNAFAANLLGATVAWSGGTFSLAAAGPGSAATSTTIALPAGKDTAISLLGSGVNGAQLDQAFVVTYTDGSTQTFTQSLSDWYTPANYAGETTAATMAYRIKSTGVTQAGPLYLYAYTFTLNGAKTVQSLTLPGNANVVVVALDVTAAAPVVSPAATPSFSLPAGSYTGTQSVSLSDATPGAAIYYTTNGSTPTTASTLYAGPVSVSATTTIEAIAVASGYTTSATASATYTISPVTGPTPVSVNLAASANLYGLANSGTPVTGGGVDGHGNAFAATLLGPTVTWSGGTFTLAASGPASAVTGKTIPLPAANDTAISLLASGVNGAQLNQTFLVTYTDGSTTSFTQSLSDWYTPAHYSGETIAATMAYRIKSTGITQTGPVYLYAYSFALNSAKTVQSITLPNNANVVVVAIDVTPATAQPVYVSLGSSGNVFGLGTAGTPVTGGGADGHGNAYAAVLLGSALTWTGGTFSLSAAGPTSAAAATTIPLPATNAASLSILAAGVNGAQLNQSFVVKYSDGTTVSFTQNVSDWATPRNYPGESTVAKMAYRIKAAGTTQSGAYDLYAYTFALNPAKTVASLSLPANANVVALAVTLTP